MSRYRELVEVAEVRPSRVFRPTWTQRASKLILFPLLSTLCLAAGAGLVSTLFQGHGAASVLLAAISGLTGLRARTVFVELQAERRVWLSARELRIRMPRGHALALPVGLGGGAGPLDLSLSLGEITAVHAEHGDEGEVLIVEAGEARLSISGLGELEGLHIALLEAMEAAHGRRNLDPAAIEAKARRRFDPPVVLRLEAAPGPTLGLGGATLGLVVAAIVVGVSSTSALGSALLFAGILSAVATGLAGSLWLQRRRARWIELSAAGLRWGRGESHTRLQPWTEVSSAHVSTVQDGGRRTDTGVRVNFRDGEVLKLGEGYVLSHEELDEELDARSLCALLDISRERPPELSE